MDGSGPMQATGSAPPGGAAAGEARTGPASPTTWRRWIFRNLALAGLGFVALVAWLRLSRPASVYPWETSSGEFGNAPFLCAWAPSKDVPAAAVSPSSAVPLAAIPGGPAATARLWPQGTFGAAGPGAYSVQIRRPGALVSTRFIMSTSTFRSIEESGPDGRRWTMLLVQPGHVPFDASRRSQSDAELHGHWTLRRADAAPSEESGATTIVTSEGAPELPSRVELAPGHVMGVNWRSQGRALAIQIRSAARDGNANGGAWNTVVGALDPSKRSFEGRDMWGRRVIGTKEGAK